MFYKFLGFSALISGIIGAVLPIIPTTPFIILSAFCFAKSSPRWHKWLQDHKIFGKSLRNWEDNRCISLKIKIISSVSILVGMAFSIPHLPISHGWMLLLTIPFIIGLIIVWTIPTCQDINNK